MRVCVYACMYAHLANISKIVQDAARAGAQAPNTGTRATTTSTEAGAGAHTHPARAHSKRN